MGAVCRLLAGPPTGTKPETAAKGFCFGENMSKNLTNHMIIWTDDGRVGLQQWPANGERLFDVRGKSWGACNVSVRESSFDDRTAMVFIHAMHMIVRDGCNPDLVHRVLSELEEYAEGCADDMPGIAKMWNR